MPADSFRSDNDTTPGDEQPPRSMSSDFISRVSTTDTDIHRRRALHPIENSHRQKPSRPRRPLSTWVRTVRFTLTFTPEGRVSVSTPSLGSLTRSNALLAPGSSSPPSLGLVFLSPTRAVRFKLECMKRGRQGYDDYREFCWYDCGTSSYTRRWLAAIFVMIHMQVSRKPDGHISMNIERLMLLVKSTVAKSRYYS